PRPPPAVRVQRGGPPAPPAPRREDLQLEPQLAVSGALHTGDPGAVRHRPLPRRRPDPGARGAPPPDARGARDTPADRPSLLLDRPVDALGRPAPDEGADGLRARAHDGADGVRLRGAGDLDVPKADAAPPRAPRPSRGAPPLRLGLVSLAPGHGAGQPQVLHAL